MAANGGSDDDRGAGHPAVVPAPFAGSAHNAHHMDRHPTVSVVVCAHDLRRLELLERAVEGVRLQDPPPHEIVLVVDHNDELLAAARERFPDVLILPNAESSGLSGARNTGVRASSGEVVAFLDDDAAPREGWIAGLLSAYRDPDVLGAGGWIIPAWQLGMPEWFPTSSCGSWAAATAGCRRTESRSAT